MNDILNIPKLFAEMRRSQKLRHRDIAAQLGISEAELIAAHTGTSLSDLGVSMRATALQARWPEIIKALEGVGKVMALTRNEACVHEKKGVYHHSSVNGQTGLVLAGAIDLRIFYQHWYHGFAVSENTEKGLQLSLQFFDKYGVAIHKVFLQDHSDYAAYDALVRQFAETSLNLPLPVLPVPERFAAELPATFDQSSFRADWRSLRDTHDFFAMLRQHGLSRTLALRQAEAAYAEALEPQVASELLQLAAQQQVPIMVFTGNPGMIQIHSGVVHKVMAMGPWMNVLDPDFNLHLRTDLVAEAWIVRKPTVDGLVCSLELFDQHGDVIAMFFGERKPGQPELCEWRALLDQLRQEHGLCGA